MILLAHFIYKLITVYIEPFARAFAVGRGILDAPHCYIASMQMHTYPLIPRHVRESAF
jgi:hypothetical protein